VNGGGLDTQAAFQCVETFEELIVDIDEIEI
jgi:hypothetical protein